MEGGIMNETSLSPAIVKYIQASNSGDIDAHVACFSNDAIVVDESATHRGVDEIRRWSEKTHVEYQFTIEALGFTEERGATVVTCQVSGAFPGSPIRLRFFF